MCLSKSTTQVYKYHYEYQWVSKLIIVNITEDSLEIHGEIDHSGFYDDTGQRWWNSYNIRRSIFMGDYVYAISHGGVTATNLDTMEETASVELPTPDPYYYYGDDAVDAEEDDGSEEGESSGEEEDWEEDDTSSSEDPDGS